MRSFRAIEHLLRAAAWSLDGAHLALPPGRSARIDRFLGTALAGSALPGSFVLSVWVRVPPMQSAEEAGLLFDPDAIGGHPAAPPYPRQATLRLHQAVTSANTHPRHALANGQGLEPFVGATSDGVSAKRCDSLVDLYGDAPVPFEWTFTWAADRPVDVSPGPLRFDAELRPVLRDAAQLLRERASSGRVRLRGFSRTLRREGRRGGVASHWWRASRGRQSPASCG